MCIAANLADVGAAGKQDYSIPLAEAIASNRVVDREILDVAIGILDKLDYKFRQVPKLGTGLPVEKRPARLPYLDEWRTWNGASCVSART